MPSSTQPFATLESLRAWIDSVPAALFVHGATGRIVDANLEACRFLGYERERLLRLRVFDIETEHNLQLETRWKRLTTGEQFACHGTHRDAKGERHSVFAKTQAFECDGQTLFSVIATPVREHLGATEQLAAARNLERDVFRTIFDHATEAIAIIDHQGRYLLQNEAHRLLLGFENQDIHDKTPAIHLGPTAFQEVAAALARDGSYRGEHTSRCKDGRQRRIEISAFAIEQDDQEAPIFVGIKRDLDERNQVERERASREIHTLEEGLRQAHKMEAVGHLAAGVAHDLNNLLTPILGFSDAERGNAELSERTRASLDSIVEAAQRGRELTRRLLMFGREHKLELRKVDLKECVHSMLDMLRRILPRRIVFELAIADTLPLTMADETTMEQVLMNLASNAADAMPEGGVLRIGLETRHIEQDEHLARMLGTGGEFVQLSVSDTGGGMTAEEVERIYEPFFSTKPAGQGTGLGLSIVHGIVRQHGGLITVDSKKGAGTTFRIFLASADARQQAANPTNERPGKRGATILLAEDEAPVRKFVQQQLEDMGYRVLPAASGAAAIESASEHAGPIDLLLSDVAMPGCSGPQLHRELQKTWPDLPVVFMSGHASGVLAAELRAAVSRPTLRKPFTAQELRVTLRTALAHRPPSQPPGARRDDPHSGGREAATEQQ